MSYNPPPPYGSNPAFPPGAAPPPYGYNPGGMHPGAPMGVQPPPPGTGPWPGSGFGPPAGAPGGFAPPPGTFPPPPIYNPPVPHSQPLPMPAADGLMMVLQGYIPPEANRFHINMMAGGGDDSYPVAFHLNPRFEGTNQVVRNAYLQGNWGDEEREGGFPLSQGADFEVIILFTNECYKVAFNGQHFCEFRYRNPKEEVTHIAVIGDVMIRCLRFQPPAHPPPGMNPPFMPPMGQPMPPMGQPMPPVAPPTSYDIPMPHKQSIPGGFVAGRRVRICGKPLMEDSFSINLCYHDYHNQDIALHFNPRFNEGCVVRNSMSGHNWGREERNQENFPFNQGQPFDMLITCYEDKFLVDVNGQRYCEYGHRLRNLSSIKTLFINNGVALSYVHFE